jgi:hypothetical protein
MAVAAYIEWVECRVGKERFLPCFTRANLYSIHRLLYDDTLLDPFSIASVRRCIVNDHTQGYAVVGDGVPSIHYHFANGTEHVERFEQRRLTRLRREARLHFYITDKLEQERLEERNGYWDADYAEFVCTRRDWRRGATTLCLLAKLWPGERHCGGWIDNGF